MHRIYPFIALAISRVATFTCFEQSRPPKGVVPRPRYMNAHMIRYPCDGLGLLVPSARRDERILNQRDDRAIDEPGDEVRDVARENATQRYPHFLEIQWRF